VHCVRWATGGDLFVVRSSKEHTRDHHNDERITPERAQVIAEEAQEAVERGEFAEARELFGHTSRIYRKLKSRQNDAGSVVRMAQCSAWIGDHKESHKQYEEAIAIYRECRDSAGLSASLQALGTAALDHENYTYAARLLNESCEICEKGGNREGVAVCLYLLATPSLNPGDLKESRNLQARADHAAVLAYESLAIAQATIRLARDVAKCGEPQRALLLFEASIRHYRNAGYLAALTPYLTKIGRRTCMDGRVELFVGMANCLQMLYNAGRNGRDYSQALREIGSHALRIGDASSAYALFKEGMARSQSPDEWRDRAASFLALGCVASREEHDDLARSLFEKAFATLKEGTAGNDLLERSIKLCRRVLYTEDLKAAALYFARCAVLARSLGEVAFYIQAMYYRGSIAIQQGDFAAANRHLEECLIYYGEVGPARRLGRTLSEKGSALFAVGDVAKGRSYMNKALEIARSEQDEVGIVAALTALGRCVPDGSDGKVEKACLDECNILSSSQGGRYTHNTVLHLLGDLDRRRGELNDACRLYLKCLIVMGHEGGLMAGAAAIEGLAIVASLSSQYRNSVRLLAKACAIRSRTGSTPTERNALELDAATSAARGALTNAEFDAAWAEGEQFGIRGTVIEAWSILESRGV